MPRIITCSDCGQQKPHSSKELCRRCYNRAWYLAHAEQQREYHRSYRITYAEKVRETDRSRNANATRREQKRHGERSRRNAHLEQVREYYRAWQSAHREQVRGYTHKWSSAHPEQTRQYGHRYHARKRALPADLTHEQWAAILAAFGHRCAYCGKKGVRLEQDHVLAVSQGGAYTAQNIVPACRNCNASKCAGPPPKPVQPLLL